MISGFLDFIIALEKAVRGSNAYPEFDELLLFDPLELTCASLLLFDLRPLSYDVSGVESDCWMKFLVLFDTLVELN